MTSVEIMEFVRQIVASQLTAMILQRRAIKRKENVSINHAVILISVKIVRLRLGNTVSVLTLFARLVLMINHQPILVPMVKYALRVLSRS